MSLFDQSVPDVYGADELIGGEMAGEMWMRWGSFKGIAIPAPNGDGEWRLFDVDKDPGETTDLADEMPELLGVLTQAWEIYAQDVSVVPAEF